MYKYSNSAREKRQGSSFMHYPNCGSKELTESQLYHMIITIDDNIHSRRLSEYYY